MRQEQMSIYDFLQDGESQEVAPSETHPQVEEAQEDWDRGHSQPIPSSALDASKLISENLVFNPEGYANKVTELPTEDTDSALFSVGDKFKVVSASSLYDTDIDPESYYYLLDYQGKTLEVKSIGDCYVITVGGQIFNFNEIIKI
ncbi:TPA: hypothetical protein QCX06_002119 [Bacillus paranthracis]|nr:hypothetical protein [Bacillus paranthracis]HDR7304516.1 hypothetical protein [Bacillus paranthracis]